MSISVIIPTYNERDCIPALLNRLDSALSSVAFPVEVLVVDDNSPDGTAELARSEADDLLIDVRVIVRESNPGLSQAVVRGFKESKNEIGLVMDADLQHPPERIPDFVWSIQGGANVVIGSRGTDGGSYGDFGLKRRVVSLGAELLSKAFVPASRKSTDPMSGFFAVELDTIDIDRLSPKGFKILLEILAMHPELTVDEIGFEFEERAGGESKFDLEESLGYVEHLISCRLRSAGVDEYISPQRATRILQFVAIGGTGVFVNMLFFVLGLNITDSYLVTGVIAFIAAVNWNFGLNHLITFRESAVGIASQYSRFLGVNIGGFMLYQSSLFVLIGMLGLWAIGSNLVAIILSSAINYIGSEVFAFEVNE